jgi:thiol-disulfide isomerase/thioredoxin
VVLLGGLLLAAAAGQAQAPGAVTAVDADGVRRALEGHKGKVVLVNFWATWCPPCVEEFPDLVKLQNRYRSRGLVVLGVSLDDPADGAKVKAFVARQQTRFPVLMARSGDPAVLVSAVDRRWNGTVPTTYLFDTAGKQVGRPIVGLRSYEQFEKLIQPLLK